MKTVNVSVTSGDISQTPCDAIITAVNSGGMWFGGIDGAITRAAGNFFHDQAAKIRFLHEGLVVIAKGGNHRHNGKFRNVVFVIDDLERPLSQVVFDGLAAASSAGFESVVLPALRMGVMLGVIEKTKGEAAGQMAVGVSRFLAEYPKSPIGNITFVVFRDQETEDLLKEAIRSKLSPSE